MDDKMIKVGIARTIQRFCNANYDDAMTAAEEIVLDLDVRIHR